MDEPAAAATPTAELADSGLVSPTQEDPFVRGGSEAIGGPLGKHARSGWSWWTPLRVLIAMVLVSSVVGYAQKLPCRSQPWQGGFQYSHACYNDVFPLYFSEGLADGKAPYLDPHSDGNGKLTGEVEYPVLIGGAMEFATKLTKLFYNKNEEGQGFVDITWVLLTLAAVLTVIATALTARRRVWDAAMVALAPSLILAGLINWDLLAVALASLGLLEWSRKNAFIAGTLFGLAIAAKFYPIVFFLPLLLLCWRARRMKAFFAAVGGAVFAWSVIDVPIWLASPEGFARFYYFSRTRTADWGSIWYIFSQWFHWNYTPSQLNLYEGGTIAIAFLGVGWIALAAPRRPRLPQLLFLTLAVFLVLNKVYSPQYVLWLLPIAVLARPRWRSFLMWQAAEVVYFLAIWMYLLGSPSGRDGKGLDFPAYSVAVCLRDVAVLALCAFIVRDIWWPQYDIVRADGSDDPAGGVLDGAPDSFDTELALYDDVVTV